MRCEKYEQDIYLYDELSPEERKVVDEHVRSCAACQSLLEEVQQQTAWVRHAAQPRPAPAAPQQLTNSILAQIEQPHTSVVTKLLAPLDVLFVRYSLAAVSLGLLVLFVSEQQRGPVVINAAPSIPAASATLNTNVFLQQYTQEKEQRKPAEPSWYQCLHDESCADSFLEMRKQRKLSSL